ncbi:MAG: hypothetical protein ABEJ04_04800 [Halobacteriaceae archaeon]
MFHRCPACGADREDAGVRVDPDGPALVCGGCDHEQSFVMPTLRIVTGAAGAGKSTVMRELAGDVDATLFEDEQLWHEAFESEPEAAFDDYVLRVLRDAAQSGPPPVLFTTGMGVPGNVEDLSNRRFFGESHYLALVCSTAEQAARLRGRAGWEGEDEWADVETQTEFGDWFRENATELGIDLLDTTDASVEETVADVRAWLAT